LNRLAYCFSAGRRIPTPSFARQSPLISSRKLLARNPPKLSRIFRTTLPVNPSQIVPLPAFFPDVQDADLGIGDAEHGPGVDATHPGELEQVGRLGVAVGAYVEEQGESARGRNERRDARSTHAGEAPDDQGRGRGDGPRAPRRHEGLGLAIAQQSRADDDRGVLLPTNCRRGRFVHPDILGRVDDLDGEPGGGFAFELGLDLPRVTGADDARAVPQLACRRHRAGHDDLDAIVSSHGVDDDPGCGLPGHVTVYSALSTNFWSP
jgi:hypothetical protein